MESLATEFFFKLPSMAKKKRPIIDLIDLGAYKRGRQLPIPDLVPSSEKPIVILTEKTLGTLLAVLWK